MFKDLQFRYKILIIPCIAAIAFIISLVLTNAYTTKNEDIINKIVKGYVPAWELSRDLVNNLALVQQNLKDAVVSQDEEKFRLADLKKDEIYRKIEAQKDNPVLDESEMEYLKSAFQEYYLIARETSKRMMDGEIGAQIMPAQETMMERYNLIDNKLSKIIQNASDNLYMGLKKSENKNKE